AQLAAKIPLSGSIQEHPASRSYDAASASDPFDPTAEISRAQWLTGLVSTSELRMNALRRAVEALTTAMGRDPFNVQWPRMRSKLYLDLAQSNGNDHDYLSAVDDARRVLDLYPLNPAGVVSLADVEAAAGVALKSQTLLREALTNYDQAIRLDDQRLSWETLHRMREREKDEILAKMRRVRELLGVWRGE
ncbi:MAG: hypothetical protein ACREXT_19280, partial [Gammaproteobacteria bacterium]